MTEHQNNPTMTDLYPDGRGYHTAHQPYMAAVAAALDTAGLTTTGHYACSNDPRDGAINLDTVAIVGAVKRVWPHTEVAVCWQEERGWWLLTVDEFDEPRWSGKGGWLADVRRVHELDVATIASPVSVVRAVAEHTGITLDLADDGHPDVDFPAHEFDEEDVAFELALRRYAKGQQ